MSTFANIRSRPTLLVLVLIVLAMPTIAATQEASTRWPLPPIPRGAVVYPDLPYVTNGSPSQKLDLYLPKEGRNLPLIIYVHGGAFCMGDKRKWIRYQLGYLLFHQMVQFKACFLPTCGIPVEDTVAGQLDFGLMHHPDWIRRLG